MTSHLVILPRDARPRGQRWITIRSTISALLSRRVTATALFPGFARLSANCRHAAAAAGRLLHECYSPAWLAPALPARQRKETLGRGHSSSLGWAAQQKAILPNRGVPKSLRTSRHGQSQASEVKVSKDRHRPIRVARDRVRQSRCNVDLTRESRSNLLIRLQLSHHSGCLLCACPEPPPAGRCRSRSRGCRSRSTQARR